MVDKIIARWQDWAGEGIEHLVLRQTASEASRNPRLSQSSRVNRWRCAIASDAISTGACAGSNSRASAMTIRMIIQMFGGLSSRATAREPGPMARASHNRSSAARSISISRRRHSPTLCRFGVSLRSAENPSRFSSFTYCCRSHDYNRSAALHPPRRGGPPLSLRIGRQRLHARHRGR